MPQLDENTQMQVVNLLACDKTYFLDVISHMKALYDIISFKPLLPPNIYEMLFDHMGKVSVSIIQKLSSIELWHNIVILSPTTTSSTISSPHAHIPFLHLHFAKFAWPQVDGEVSTWPNTKVRHA